MPRSTPSERSTAVRSRSRHPSVRTLMRHADELLFRHASPTEILEVFDKARVAPPRAWLLRWALSFWGQKWDHRVLIRGAILFFERAGATEELNRIGEFFALDGDSTCIDAFAAAGNLVRLREMGERFLRMGNHHGLRAFEALGEDPPPELVRTYALAAFEAKELVQHILPALRHAGIVLPRTVFRDAAREYGEARQTYSARLLRAAALEPRR